MGEQVLFESPGRKRDFSTCGSIDLENRKCARFQDMAETISESPDFSDGLIIEGTKLKLFHHQVSGHGAFLKISRNKVCKPVVKRELEFYETVKTNCPDIIPFLANYHGTVDLNFNDVEPRQLYDSESDTETTGHSRWSKHLIKKEFANQGRQRTSKYIVLQDLSKSYKKPSIMDLKMGTKTFGQDATPQKIASKSRKAKETTTRTLGMRLCGQQIYHPKENQFKIVNKYEGHKLTDEKFEQFLAQYFWNGERMRVELLPLMIDKLKELLQIIKKGVRYVFYATSLLLLYDGDENNTKVDVKMIDFGHTYPYTEGQIRDDGFEFGLTNLISILEKIYSIFEPKTKL